MKQRFDRMRLGGADDAIYEVFDPPWWRLDRWAWWWARVRRADAHGTISFVYRGEMRRFRCHRVG